MEWVNEMDIDEAINFLMDIDIEELVQYRKAIKEQMQASKLAAEQFRLSQRYFIAKSIWAARK